MIFYYGTEISPNQTETVEGYLICRNVPIARTGPMEYTARDLKLDGDPDRVITVNRYEEDVFEPAALASFEGKSVTDGHPTEEVNPDNFGAYEKGHVENVRRDGDYMVADLYIKDSSLISDIKNGVKREVSCGYVCSYVPDGTSYKQQNIRGNHVAVVPRGRAGHEVSIKDESPKKNKGGKTTMGKFTKDLLKIFGAAAKDAAPEEINEMADTAATVLDAAPSEKEPEAEPTGDKAEEKPAANGLESKIDEMLSLMRQFIGKDSEEKKLSDESDIDKAIDELSGGKKPKEEGSETISAEKSDDESESKDAALEFLKKVRPAVAAIQNRGERAKVTDALLSAVKGNENKIGDILAAAQDSARRNAETKKDYDTLCREQKAAYDAFNPHKNKEVK